MAARAPDIAVVVVNDVVDRLRDPVCTTPVDLMITVDVDRGVFQLAFRVVLVEGADTVRIDLPVQLAGVVGPDGLAIGRIRIDRFEGAADGVGAGFGPFGRVGPDGAELDSSIVQMNRLDPSASK